MNNSCCSCLKPNASLECGLCKEAVCKKCAHFLAEDSFSFLTLIPQELSHQVYCSGCYQDKILPQQESYNETLQRAKDVAVFFKAQSKETRLMSRKNPPVTVNDCADKEEAVLKLAFLAASQNLNAVIDVDVCSKKIRMGTYQTQVWSGSGVPLNVSEKKLSR